MEKRYQEFLAALKKRIPMAEMFLTGALETSLNEQVQIEIAKLLPELKQLIREHWSQEEMQEWVKTKLQTVNLSKIRHKYLWRVIFSLGAISFSFGLVQLLLFLMIC